MEKIDRTNMQEGGGWEGVTPIPQNDPPNGVVKIAYSQHFCLLMDLFRAVLSSGEKSSRALQLTADIIAENAANYTVWQYRREIIFALNLDLDEEIEYLDSFAEDNPKNYQLWYHRKVIVDKNRKNYRREIEFCNSVFELDAKNYHAWAYRQWLISTFDLWELELSYVEELIQRDIRNNSAWNQRWFIHQNNPYQPFNEQQFTEEIKYVFQNIEKASNNESVWNYLRGLYYQYNTVFPSKCAEIENRLIEMLHKEKESAILPTLLLIEFVADIKSERQTKVALEDALGLYAQLEAFDMVRAKYWQTKFEEVKVLHDYF